jgi:hypothetical protein
MSTTEASATGHPIAWFASRVHGVLDGLAGAAAWSMTPEEQRTSLVQLARAEARLAELRLRVLAAADLADVGAQAAATSTAAWVAQHTRQTRPGAAADVRLAKQLDGSYAATRVAVADGRVDIEQARVIVRSVEALPVSTTEADRKRAEAHLVELAADHDARALRILGRRVLEVIDPAAADEELGRKLEAEEAEAARRTCFRQWDNHNGTHSGRFTISDLHAAMLAKMLHAFTNPRHRHARGQPAREPAAQSPDDPQRRDRPDLLGHAFCALLERIPLRRLPRLGGVNASVVVLMDLQTLLSGIGAASLDTGQEISAGQARRLFCQSGVIPAVYGRRLDGATVPLDVGRESRYHDRYQRLALTIRDRGCTGEHCDRPPSWCHAHHETPWSEGGDTNVERGRLLCPFHHGRAHSPRYQMDRLPDGSVRFHRRT